MFSNGRPRGGAHNWIRSNILGLVAIFIALSGSAVAANVADQSGGKATKAAKKKKAKPGPAGPAGAQGPQGTQGLQGVQGVPGTARAYAYISANGTVVQASGIAQANVNHASATSPYCFGGLDFTPQSIDVQMGLANAGNPIGFATADAGVNANNLACPAGFRQALVALFGGDGNPFGVFVQRPFYVVLN